MMGFLPILSNSGAITLADEGDVLLPNGSVLVVGGYNSPTLSTLPSAEIYDRTPTG